MRHTACGALLGRPAQDALSVALTWARANIAAEGFATSFVFGKGGHPTQTKKIDTMDVWRVDLTESDDEGGGTPQSSSGDAGNYPGTLRERSLSFHAEVDEITREFLAVGCAPELSVLERCVTKTLPSSPFPPL